MTSNEWKKCKLFEIAEFNPIETIKKGQLAKKIAMENLIPYCKQIPSFERCKYNGGTKFRNGDTIMARITPCLENGKISKVTILNDNEIGFGSTEYIVFRAIESLSNPDFLYYLITSSLVKEPAIKSMVGSSGRQRVQIDVVKNIEIDIPPLETQQKIAKILSAIDDKIELNNSINNNLEQQIKYLYNDYFCNCNEEIKITELIDVRDGTHDSPKSTEQGKHLITSKHLKKYGIDKSTANIISEFDYAKINERSVVCTNDILISMIGTVGIVSLIIENPVDFAVKNVGIFKTSNFIEYTYYIHCFLNSNNTQNYIKSHLAGTTQKYISLGELRNLIINKPDESQLNKFNLIVHPLYQQIILNVKENVRLTQLRDTLLPKLMNGEIDVSKVDIDDILENQSTDKLL